MKKPNLIENVVDLGYDKSNTNQPFTIAFCYPRSGPIVIKGVHSKVRRAMEIMINGTYHYKVTHWRHGYSRGYWAAKPADNLNVELKFIYHSNVPEKRFELVGKANKVSFLISRFNKVPRNYIAEFDVLEEIIRQNTPYVLPEEAREYSSIYGVTVQEFERWGGLDD